MNSRELINKPLIEAIFELRWALQDNPKGFSVDPNYRLLLGRMFDRLETSYPAHEQLPTATLPDEMVGYTVQHRFRAAQGGWPLVQLGPGIMSVNETNSYGWLGFKKHTIEAVDHLFACYPKANPLIISNLALRYINSVELPSEDTNVYAFLEENLKVQVKVPKSFFEGNGVVSSPSQLQLNQVFESKNPVGQIQLRVSRGKKEDRDSLIWETIFQSAESDCPMPEGVNQWLENAHRLVKDWFYKMIDGELHRRFRDA